MQNSYQAIHSLRKTKYPNLKKVISFVLILLFFPRAGIALPSDREKPAKLSADAATLDQQGHFGEYTGNVDFEQGTTRLTAEKAITKGDEKNKLVEAAAMGTKEKQAHYWMLTSPSEPMLHAYADLICYYPDKHIVELIGHARIVQGENSFSSDKIIYDINKQHLVSKGNKKTRTTIIIYPEKKGLATTPSPISEKKS